MIRKTFLVLIALVAASLALGQAALKLKPGDILHVTVTAGVGYVPTVVPGGGPTSPLNDPYSGDYPVMSDGAIYGSFGRIVVSGKTVLGTQTLVRTALKRFVKPDEVFVSLKIQLAEVVYLIVLPGEPGAQLSTLPRGPLPYLPNQTLRQLLSQSAALTDPMITTARLMRDGKQILSLPMTQIADPGQFDTTLKPGDIVALIPQDYIRVYVSGYVRQNGRIRIPAGSTLENAIATSGGFLVDPPGLSGGALDRSELSVKLRRNGVELSEPLPGNSSSSVPLQDGDEIVVSASPIVRVTVLGEVMRPGEYATRGKPDLFKAMTLAGGPTPVAALSNLMVIRGSQRIQVDALAMKSGAVSKTFDIEPGDLIVVQRNERLLYVLGEVIKPAAYPMDENHEYHLTDALALGGGLRPDAALRRIYVSRTGPDGKQAITLYNLDEFLKDGKTTQNPVLKPGDAVLFGKASGMNVNALQQLLTSAVLAITLLRGH